MYARVWCRDAHGRRVTEVVAIDALVFYTYQEQFKEHRINRELNKVRARDCARNLEHFRDIGDSVIVMGQTVYVNYSKQCFT